jgi:RNA polymerase sigma factor (sigma-70 family)
MEPAMTTKQMKPVIRYLRNVAMLPGSQGLTDGQLLERFTSLREEAAFEELLRRHGPMVLGVCRRVLGNAHDAEDAFQATFLVLVRKAAAILPREMVGNWLYGVAYHTALRGKTAAMKRRAKERQVAVVAQMDLGQEEVWQELQPLLDHELHRLPDHYRMPVVLCDLEGKSYKEAARQLGCPQGTLASRLVRARTLLAKRLKNRGLQLSAGAVAALLPHKATATVPVGLARSSNKAASLYAAGQTPLAGLIPAKVLGLTEGVLKAMLLSKLKIAALFMLAMGTVMSASGLTYRALATQAGQPKAAPKPEDEAVGEIRRFEGHTDGVHWVAVSPDGRLALSCAAQPGQDDPTVRLWEVKTGKELKRLLGHTERVECVAFSPDGKLAASSGADNTIRLWDVTTGQELRRLEGHGDNVYAVMFSPDGKRLLSGSEDKTLRLWDVDTGQEVRKFEGHTEAVRGVAISPDGKKGLSAGWDRTARLWDLDNGTEIRSFEGHTEDHVMSVAFSPDGKRAVSCGEDESIRLWDLDNGQEVRCFKGHSDKYVYVAVFSRDGKRLLSGGEDKTVRLWDVDTGKELHCFSGHEERVRGVVFSPDSRYALSGSVDKTLRLWRLPK